MCLIHITSDLTENFDIKTIPIELFGARILNFNERLKPEIK